MVPPPLFRQGSGLITPSVSLSHTYSQPRFNCGSLLCSKKQDRESGSQANIDNIGWVVLSDTFMAPKMSGEAQLEGTCASKITILRSL